MNKITRLLIIILCFYTYCTNAKVTFCISLYFSRSREYTAKKLKKTTGVSILCKKNLMKYFYILSPNTYKHGYHYSNYIDNASLRYTIPFFITLYSYSFSSIFLFFAIASNFLRLSSLIPTNKLFWQKKANSNIIKIVQNYDYFEHPEVKAYPKPLLIFKIFNLFLVYWSYLIIFY